MHDFNFCPKCGECLNGNEYFCPGCGFRLVNDNPAPPEPTQATPPPVASPPPPTPVPEPEPTPAPEPNEESPELSYSAETEVEESADSDPTSSDSAPAYPGEGLSYPGSGREPEQKAPEGQVLGYVNGRFGYYNPYEVDTPPAPSHPAPLPHQRPSGMRNVWIAVISAVVVVAVGLSAWYFISDSSKLETEMAKDIQGEALLTGPKGVKYYFPKDVDRFDVKGDVFRMEESYVTDDSDVTITYEFDTDGYLTASMGDPIAVPNEWGNDFKNPNAKYNHGLLVSSQARRPSKSRVANLTYEYKPKDAKTVEVFRIFNDGKRELAMTLNFDDNGMLLTRVEEPYKDTYAYDSKGRQSIYSGEIAEDKVLKTDEKGNWTEKFIGNGVRIVRRLEYR